MKKERKENCAICNKCKRLMINVKKSHATLCYDCEQLEGGRE